MRHGVLADGGQNKLSGRSETGAGDVRFVSCAQWHNLAPANMSTSSTCTANDRQLGGRFDVKSAHGKGGGWEGGAGNRRAPGTKGVCGRVLQG